MRAFLEQQRPEVVHLVSSWAGSAGRVVLWPRLAPAYHPRITYYSPQSFAFLRRDVSLPARLAFWAAEAILSRTPATICLATSPYESRLARRFGGPVADCFNAAATPRSTPGDALPEVLALSGVPEGPDGLVVSGGRLEPQKDPLFMLDTAVRVLRECPGTRFVWVGSGSLRAQVDERLRRATPLVRDRLTFLPWLPQDQFLALLSRATLLLHTARWESLSMVILEAMAREVPVVVRRGASCHDVVEQEGCGLVASRPEDAAAHVLRLLGSAELRRELGLRGSIATRGPYSLDRLLGDLERFYKGDKVG
jgi:glycosyltransferase involved in cell wall biosynthesis